MMHDVTNFPVKPQPYPVDVSYVSFFLPYFRHFFGFVFSFCLSIYHFPPSPPTFLSPMLFPPPYILPPFARQDRKKSSSIHTICPLSSPSSFCLCFPGCLMSPAATYVSEKSKALWRIGVDLAFAQIESVVGRWRWGLLEYCTKKQIWPAAEDMFERQDYPGCLDPVLTKSHLTWARRLVMMKWT
jgi:hypothetical protein